MSVVLIGVVFIVIGLFYLYSTSLVLKFYGFLKNYILSDKSVILYGKKIGLFFLLIGAAVITFTVVTHYTTKDLYYMAYKQFFNGDFKKSEKLCYELLSVQPQNVDVLELLGKIYIATGRYKLAKSTFLKIKKIEPEKAKKVERYLKAIREKK